MGLGRAVWVLGNYTLVKIFWDKVDVTPGCWWWTSAVGARGYGVFGNPAKSAHRVAYALIIGPIPPGLTLDHLCGNKTCVNPYHLDPCTTGENTRRYAATITHCPAGHEYNAENTRIYKGRRHCRKCGRAACRAWYAKKARS